MRPAGGAVTLDGETDLEVTFTLSPEDTARLAPGEHRVRLRYRGEGAPADEWQGSAESVVVVVTVVAQPAEPTAEQTWTAQYARTQYHLASGEPAKARAAADAMLAAVPESVLGFVQRGRAREAEKDLVGALADFRAALASDRKERPRGCAPAALLHAVRRLSEAVGGR